MSAKIRCYVEPQSRTYADGLEAVELYVSPEDSETLAQKPVLEQRLEFGLITKNGHYRGGLRIYQATGQVYVCPDLKSDPDGRRISLAKVLKEHGIEPKQHIEVVIEDGIWQLPH